MKIWLLLSRFEDGGLERVQLELACAMRERNLDVQLVAGSFSRAGTVIPADIPCRSISPSSRAWFPFGLLRLVRQEQPNVIVTTSDDVACMVLAMRLLRLTSTRVVVSQHLSISGPLRSASGLRRLKLQFIRTLMRCLFPRADRIVSVTHAVAEDITNELSIPGNRIDVIHNPVIRHDTTLRMEENAPWPWTYPDVPTIVFVGRLAKVKRIDLLIDAFEMVRRRIECRLLIIGAGPMRGPIHSAIETRGLDDCCVLAGHVHNPLPFIRRSDVLVLPSDYEGFGLVLVEAMACGTQVIATDCPDGPAEILQDGKYGQLVPCGDAVALSIAMSNVLLKNSMVPKEALMHRAQDFTLERAVDGYLDVFSSISRDHLEPTPG